MSNQPQERVKKRTLSPEKARQMTAKAWEHYPTPESRRLRTLQARVESGRRAEAELDALLRQAALKAAVL